MAALRIFEPKGGSPGDFVDKSVNLNFEGHPLENHEARYSSIQVIVAALNEEQGIGLTIAELKDTLDSPRILVVDGHSSDKTVEIAKSLGVDIAFQDGVGKGDTISRALKLTSPNAEYVVITDADITYPAEHVPGMIKILEQDPDVGMVGGNRFNSQLDNKALDSRFLLRK